MENTTVTADSPSTAPDNSQRLAFDESRLEAAKHSLDEGAAL